MSKSSILSSSPRDQQRKLDSYPTTSMQLFDAKYWYMNGNRNADFAYVTDSGTMRAYVKSYYYNDFIGLIWEAQDRWSHPGRAYFTKTDYTGVVWTFDIVLSSNMPTLDDQSISPTITITYSDSSVAYVPLFQFADDPTGRSARITFDFDDMTGGFGGSTYSSTNISQIMLGLTAVGYDAENLTRRSTPLEFDVEIQTVSVTGGSLTRNNLIVPKSGYGVSTSYDDQHIHSPEKIIGDLQYLGFDGFINHFVGMSRYGNKEPNPDGGDGSLRYIETLGNTINKPTEEWHRSLAENISQAGLDCVWGVSYETFSPFANVNYVQQDWDSNFAVTGYNPPSLLISPCIEPGMEYLGNVFEDFAAIMDEHLAVKMQIGEPWWWFNSGDLKPCVYDYPTKLLFNEETGLFAPNIETINDLTNIDLEDDGPLDVANDTLEQTWIKWLRDKLGESVLYLRDRVKSAFPGAEATTLFFLPSILDESVGIINIVNYPKAHYSYPNLDFFQTETYDWLLRGDLIKGNQAATVPINELGYSPSDVWYLAGFVPSEQLAQAINFTVLSDKYKGEIWARIMGKSRVLREEYGLTKQSIWAYPQVVNDGFVPTQEHWHEIGEDRSLLREVRTDRAPNYIIPGTGGGTGGGGYDPDPPEDPDPPPTPPEKSYNLHVLGDSFVTESFRALLDMDFGNRYELVTKDGVGATSVSEQKVRFDSTPEYYGSTLVIMDGGLDEFSQPTMDAIDGIVANLDHDRWVWVQPSPSSYKIGTSQRTFWDSEVAAIAAHVGSDHYVEVLPALHAANDGSPEDLQDVDDGLVPRSLRLDYIHENYNGETVRTGVIADFIRNKGW